jgi:PAS domain S-box-containing protein
VKSPILPLIVAALVLGAVALFFARSSHIVFAEHKRFDRELDRLHERDAKLNEDVLKTRFHLLDNYDNFQEVIGDLRRTSGNLVIVPSFVSDEGRVSIHGKLDEFVQLLAAKEQLLETFKSQNAVLNNSLRYLPVAATDLLQRVALDEGSRPLVPVLQELIQQVLVYCLNPSEELAPAIHELLNGIAEWREQHATHALAGTVGTFAAHVKSIVDRKPQVEELTRQLVSIPTGQRVGELMHSYEAQFDDALGASNRSLLALKILCGLLVVVVASTIYALHAANARLERRVTERTAALQQEVVERRRTEEAMRESEHRYRHLIQTLPAAIYTCNSEGRITLYNEAAVALWGRAPEIGEDLWCGSWRIFSPEGRPIELEDCPMARTIRDGVSIRGEEIVIERADGGRSYVLPHPDPLRDASGRLIGAINMLVDLSQRKETEAKLEKMHRELLETSRQAGMAEVATSVLHNVGNVLNSVNVSATLVGETVRKSKVVNLGKVVALLDEQGPELGSFIDRDPRGRQLPAYLRQLHERLKHEQEGVVTELDSLGKNIEHIKDIVAMQQSYGKVSGVAEVMNVTELVEDSVRMNAAALSRHQVEVTREFDEVPPISVEKHKILQILVNLIRNAKYACDESLQAEKRLTLRVENREGRVRISVSDNGVGIPPENLSRIFSHGFTTRKDGHGFGLHSGALAARQMGGSLSAHSAGPGQGATFTLDLPCPVS